MTPVARILPEGDRLHLQHGPIDLVIGVDGDRKATFHAAQDRFETLLQELVDELPVLRTQMTPTAALPQGKTARRMDRAARPLCGVLVTRMAAVAGAVSDEILNAMQQACKMRRAYVNNGGDIAIHLNKGEVFRLAMSQDNGVDLGRIEIKAEDGVHGIATSGQRGRSLSLGIADSVTVLAASAAQADVAATLIANTVDIPGHPAIRRAAAVDVQPDSDLQDQLVVTQCGPLTPMEIQYALAAGHNYASVLRSAGHIQSAALFLQGQNAVIGTTGFPASSQLRVPEYA